MNESTPPVRERIVRWEDPMALARRARDMSGLEFFQTLLREVAWSVEKGALARFEVAHAMAIACKKIREGGWSTPFRMPVDWPLQRAQPETCGPAGRY